MSKTIGFIFVLELVILLIFIKNRLKSCTKCGNAHKILKDNYCDTCRGYNMF